MLSLLRKLSLTQWILIAMVLGTVVGWAFPLRDVTGKVKSVSADGKELVVAAADGQERTIRREEGAKLTIDSAFKASEPRVGDTVKVEPLGGWVLSGTTVTGKVKAVSADNAAMVIRTAEDNEVTVRREERNKVTIETGPGKAREPRPGDMVHVEYDELSAQSLKPLSTIFLRMIKSLIAPLIFATLVIGIAGHGDDMKRVGRLAFKSLLYFEIVTTLALVIGLVAVNLTQPGVGVALEKDRAKQGQEFAAKQTTFSSVLEHIVPQSVFEAAVHNEVLQIVFWSILFAVGLTQVKGRARETMLRCLESLADVMFKFTGLVMKYAPVGIGAAIAVTVGHKGLEVLWNLGKLILTLYGALVVFMLVVLLPTALIARVPLRKFGRAVKEPALIAFSTTSSEAALPKAMLAMEAIGVPKRIVAFVMPTGYSFNLDGTTLYLAVASIFAAQAAGVHMDWQQQVVMMLTLMLTSKGVAAVPRASLVILAGTLASFNLPLEAVAVILGVDELMDMARTTVNLIGNCLATCVMARWEGEFDDNATGRPPEEPAPDAQAQPSPPVSSP